MINYASLVSWVALQVTILSAAKSPTKTPCTTVSNCCTSHSALPWDAVVAAMTHAHQNLLQLDMWGISAAAKALQPNIIKVPEGALHCNVCVFMHAYFYCLQKHLSVLEICSTDQCLREGLTAARQEPCAEGGGSFARFCMASLCKMLKMLAKLIGSIHCATGLLT